MFCFFSTNESTRHSLLLQLAHEDGTVASEKLPPPLGTVGDPEGLSHSLLHSRGSVLSQLDERTKAL